MSAYRLFSGRLGWEEARAACAAAGARLATLDDARAQDAAAATIPLPVWLGLSDTGEGWRDADGRPPRFLNFAPGEPGLPSLPRCLIMEEDNRWYDRACPDRNAFVCEVAR